MHNRELRVFGLFREHMETHPENQRIWIYICLKRWYYYWKHICHDRFIEEGDAALIRRIPNLAAQFAAAIDMHIHQPCAGMTELQDAYYQVERQISRIIEEEAP